MLSLHTCTKNLRGKEPCLVHNCLYNDAMSMLRLMHLSMSCNGYRGDLTNLDVNGPCIGAKYLVKSTLCPPPTDRGSIWDLTTGIGTKCQLFEQDVNVPRVAPKSRGGSRNFREGFPYQ